MRLAELVSHVKGPILRDVAAPSLWADDELIKYFNEAEGIFARRTHVLTTDEDAELSEIVTEPGKARYDLHPSVVFVYEMFDDNGYPIRSRSKGRMPRYPTPGKPSLYTADAKYRQVKLYPVPDDVYTVHMDVAHMPSEKMASDGDEPQIPEEYHLLLCQYAAYMALTNNDPEGSDTISAGEFFARWETGLIEAKRDISMARYGRPGRVVNSWTGGRR